MRRNARSGRTRGPEPSVTLSDTQSSPPAPSRAYRWADALRQAQLDVLSASASAVTLAAPTEEAVYAEEGADAVDGVGEGFGGRVRGASTASETGVPETAGDVAQQC